MREKGKGEGKMAVDQGVHLGWQSPKLIGTVALLPTASERDNQRN